MDLQQLISNPNTLEDNRVLLNGLIGSFYVASQTYYKDSDPIIQLLKLLNEASEESYPHGKELWSSNEASEELGSLAEKMKFVNRTLQGLQIVTKYIKDVQYIARSFNQLTACVL